MKIPLLLITYDLKKSGRDYASLLEAIRTYPHAQVSKSAYVIQTNAKSQQVFDQLNQLIDANDIIFIVAIADYAGKLLPEAIDFLAERA